MPRRADLQVQDSDLARFWCRSCGMVRDSDVAPWCRHNDGDRALPATRMEPLPSWHPLAKEER